MKNQVKTALATAILFSLGTAGVQAEEGGIPVMDNIKVKGELRPRYEMVDEDNPLSNANAVTNRLVIGVNADLFGTEWLSGYAEMTDVHNANDNYNSTNNGRTGYSVVADPEQTRLSQSYVDIKVGKTLFRTGRQMVNLDNQRFVGAVGWRQMPQTFNAFAIVDNTFDKLSLLGAYVNQVNTVKAGDANNFQTSSVLLHANYKAMDVLNVTAYGYLIGSLNDTYGVALTGKTELSGGTKVDYRVEYAMQGDASMETANQGKPDADASYMNFQAGANMKGFLLGARYEVLSGTNGTDNKTAFITPLATLHGQNGWADRFLNTPSTGLVDMNLMLGYKAKGFGVAKAIYHDFSSDVNSINYGTELDLLYKNAIPGLKNVSGLLKAAMYKGGDTVNEGNSAALATDKTVFWAMMDYKF